MLPGQVQGCVRAPASKSHQQRLLLAAALSVETTHLSGLGPCADAVACLRVVQALGTACEGVGDTLSLRGGVRAPKDILECGESGFCLRASAALAARFGQPITLNGTGSLAQRPMDMVLAPLHQLGVRCGSLSGHAPLVVKGPLRSGRVGVDGSTSSQALSGLLLALPTAEGDSLLEVKGLNSGAYVQMTLGVMKAFGVQAEASPDLGCLWVPGGQSYRAGTFTVQGDWSGAAFLLVAGAMAGEIRVEGLRPNSLQPDRAILDALTSAGAAPGWRGGGIQVAESTLKGFDFDATNCPDLFPPLALLACHAAGRSRIWGAHRLRHKESDRALTLCSELGALGARISLRGDCLEVFGSRLNGGQAVAHGDHRIAMACALAALRARKGVELFGAGCVGKSYPGFFGDLVALGAIWEP